MEAGADNCLRKPVNSHELRVRLRAGRRIIDLQEELVNAREALRRQAKRCCAKLLCVRPYDSPCRYGGEKFLMVMPGCDLAGATMRAEKIRSAMGAAPFQMPEGVLSVTCSVGLQPRREMPASMLLL